MSSWLSIENFLYSRTATWCRRGLVAIGFTGLGIDYYVMNYYQTFDPASEGQQYVVTVSSIGRRRCQLLMLPNLRSTNYSPWTPKDGDVVVAREVPGEPDYLQLLGGRYVERRTCGVELLRPLAEMQMERAVAHEKNKKLQEMMRQEKGLTILKGAAE